MDMGELCAKNSEGMIMSENAGGAEPVKKPAGRSRGGFFYRRPQ
jgi:hypothetical protein